jgi:hypothetical protein
MKNSNFHIPQPSPGWPNLPEPCGHDITGHGLQEEHMTFRGCVAPREDKADGRASTQFATDFEGRSCGFPTSYETITFVQFDAKYSLQLWYYVFSMSAKSDLFAFPWPSQTFGT